MSRRHRFTLGSFGVVEFDSELLDSRALYGPILPSCKEMALLDREEIATRTLSVDLMLRAGEVVVEEINNRFPSARSFMILVGPGNNGGDGLVVARILLESGKEVSVVAVTAERFSAEWNLQAAKLSTSNLASIAWFPTVPSTSPLPNGGGRHVSQEELLDQLSTVDVVIDALLGTGQNRAPQDALATLVTLLQRHSPEAIVSIDPPTGVNSDTGGVYSPCVHAGLTIALQGIKRGMLQFPARSMCGDIVARDIGINCVSGGKIPLPSEFSAYLGQELATIRTLCPDVHKGRRGSVLVIGGSRAMPGAPALSATAALHAGAGLVTVASKSSWGTFEYLPPEVMRIVTSGEGVQFTLDDASEILGCIGRYSAVVVGPGMGEGDYDNDGKASGSTKEFTRSLIEACAKRGIPLVLDASGIHHMVKCQFTPRVTSSPNPLVLTPHPGEGAALLECSTEAVQKDRFAAVRQLAERCQGVALLKGAGTLVHNGERGYVVPLGTPYLATAGSGDVLTGVVATYLSQGVDPFLSAAAAAYHHAWAGCAAAHKNLGTTASDIAAELGRFTADASEVR
jgi:hydroxyethylthiazole kinase-like uncharacterized protein yjeF